MKNYFNQLKVLLYRILLLIVVFEISRLLFYLFNLKTFSNSEFSDILISFVWGIRFDLWTILWFNIFYILIFFIHSKLGKSKILLKVLKYYFIIVNSLILLPNLVDIEYFKFTNKRSTSDLFSLITTGNDTLNLLPQFLKDFWYLMAIWVLLIVIIVKCYNILKLKSDENVKFKKWNYVYQLIIFIISGFLIFIVLRGTNLRPVNIMSASRFVTSNEIPLVLNTPFTIIRTMGKDNLQIKEYLPENIAQKYFNPIYFPAKTIQKFNKKQNVVIIILESFSKEYIGYFNKDCKGYTPFLDSLFNNSLVFNNSFANGKKSIESLPAILAGIPSLSETPYVLSKYSTNKIIGLPAILKKNGYNTSFYHGGVNGTMGFDNFSHLAGCDNYYGKKEYPFKEDYDGNWGIWDEPYLQYFATQLNKKNQPFFSVIYTLSSHHPFKIPTKYSQKFKEGKSEILKCISYTDYSLKEFFNNIKKYEWYKNTLFVITADHTSGALSNIYSNKIGTYSVPIVLYNPGDSSLIGTNNNIVQHADIMPTVLSYLNISDTIICFGSSAFDTTKFHFSINYINGNYQITKKNFLLLFDGDKSVALYNFINDEYLKNNLINENNNVRQELENDIKSIIQCYNNRIIKNKLTQNKW